ncbi:hypothetical protein ACIBHY_51535 [Nonomuraea sp. NPDC050547]|uniref:hypothetical protein n=1 Tax=unclassified Nonomuraea TaxID=2593643 RepID=UPI00378AE0A0
MAHRSRIRRVLAGLSLAGLGLLAPMGGASAAAAPPSPGQEIRSGESTQKAVAAVNCWTTIAQPGGNGTTITVYYRNCGGASAVITPNSHAVAFDGTYTYVGNCYVVAPGATRWWEIPPSKFPPADTTRWGVTNCV